MRSRQINLFITPSDMAGIQLFLKTKSCILIRNNVQIAKIDSKISLDKEDVFQIFISRKDFINKIFFKQVKDNYYYVDVVKSLAIEFDIGGFYPYSKKELHRGRLYMATSFYENETIDYKAQEFIQWAKEIYNAFQKAFLTKEKKYMGYYFSKNALKWNDINNAEIVEGGLKFISLKE